MLTVFREILIGAAAGGVGTVGNSQRWLRRVFQARWEQWKNGRLFFHGFQGAAVSTASPSGRATNIDLSNAMSTKIDLPDSVGQGRPQGHRVSPKGFAEPKDPVVERNPTLVLNLAHDG